MRSVCTVDGHVTANNIKTSSVTIKKLFYGEFISPRTIKRTYRSADKSLARPGRTQATATKLFCKPFKKKFRRLSIRPGLHGSNDLRVGRKKTHFQLLFFSWVGLRTYQHPCMSSCKVSGIFFCPILIKSGVSR